MDIIQSKPVSMGLFFLFIFISGYWLSHAGKPYSTFPFTIHKLVGLAMGTFLIVTVYRNQQVLPLHPAEMAVIAGTALVFVLLVVAGGLLSIQAAGGLGNVSPSAWTAILLVHKILPYLAVFSSAVTLYFLLKRG